MKYKREEGLSDMPSVFLLAAICGIFCLTAMHYMARITLWPLFDAINAWILGDDMTTAWQQAFRQAGIPSLRTWIQHWWLLWAPITAGLGILQVWGARNEKIRDQKYRAVCWTVVGVCAVLLILDIVVNVPNDMRQAATILSASIRDLIWALGGGVAATYLYLPIHNYLRRWFE